MDQTHSNKHGMLTIGKILLGLKEAYNQKDKYRFCEDDPKEKHVKWTKDNLVSTYVIQNCASVGI